MKTKLKVFFAALAAVVGLSSCLDSNNDGTSSNTMFLRPISYMGYTTFVGADGVKYTPTSAIDPAPTTSDLALVGFSYNTADVTNNMKELNISVLGVNYLKRINVLTDTDKNDCVTTTIVNDGSYGDHVMFWSKDFMLIPMYFMLHKSTTTSNLTTEFAKHNVGIYFDQDEAIKDNTLKLYLTYSITGLDTTNKEQMKEYSVKSGYYVTYNLNYALNAFKGLNGGKNPEKIQIVYSKPKSVTGLVSAGEGEETSVTVDCSSVFGNSSTQE